ncbi:MAG TPA: radical SAM protein [Armatimonadetes bacterium]|nr:radical SAM protein [Armatimonadota bacterium]
MKAQLTGLAKIAADSPQVDARNAVEYFSLPCKSVLNRVCPSKGTRGRLSFAYTINPYRGCEFGCAYCFARYTHEYLGFEGWLAFERKIYVKEQAAEVLAGELNSAKLQGQTIAIGTVTDPYQPAERRFEVTRRILAVLAQHRGLRLSLTTKSDLILRDLDLLQILHQRHHLCLNVTLTVTDRHLSRRLEPRAPRPEKRLRAVRGLAAAGLTVGVFYCPVMPLVNDSKAALEAACRTAAEAGAQYLAWQALRLRSAARERFYPWLAETFPQLLARYRRLYAGDIEPPLAYRERVQAELDRFRQQYGLAAGPPPPPADWFAEEQLILPFPQP